MKKILPKSRRVVMFCFKRGWPLLLADVLFGARIDAKFPALMTVLNMASLLWLLSAILAPFCFLLDRALRERLMTRLCGMREGDEREHEVTGEAARATLLLALSLQAVLLAMTLVKVRLDWNPRPPTGEHRGTLSVGVGASDSHLNPFGGSLSRGAPPLAPAPGGTSVFDGYLLPPSSFPLLAVLILVELAAFRGFAARRYEGDEA